MWSSTWCWENRREVDGLEDSICSCRLFRGLEGEQLREALDFFGAREVAYKKGEQLIRIGDAMPSFGLVLEGAVSVCSTDINGNRMIMASVGRGETFGESLSFLQVRESPIYAQADSDCRILWLSTSRLHAMQEQQEPEGCAFTGRFIAMLAERTLSMNNRIQVLSKKSLREKLMTFLTQREQESGSFAFEISMDRSAMADYLGVDRSALSRELSRLRDEGALKFRKNHFEIVDRRLLNQP